MINRIEAARRLLEFKRKCLMRSANRGQTPRHGATPARRRGARPIRHKPVLTEVSKALSKLDTGEFGYCEVCHMEIPWAEIARVPERDRCEACLSE